MPGRKITIGSGPRKGSVIDVEDKTPTAPGGMNDEGKQESVDEAVERMAGTSSNTGRSGQSTDSINKYQ